ncbi:MAG: hypothetical protein ACK56I_09355, partial [bacterium]
APVLQADQPGRAAGDFALDVVAEQRGELGKAVAQILHRVVARGLAQALGAPLGLGRLGLSGRIPARRALVAREAQPLVRREVAVVLEEVAAQAELAGHVLADAHETQPRVAQRHAVVGVPTLEKATARLDRDAAHGGSVEHPARIAEAHPGLARRLLHVLHRHPADAVGQHVVARAGDRMRQPGEAELVEARQELRLVLPAEEPEHPA